MRSPWPPLRRDHAILVSFPFPFSVPDHKASSLISMAYSCRNRPSQDKPQSNGSNQPWAETSKTVSPKYTLSLYTLGILGTGCGDGKLTVSCGPVGKIKEIVQAFLNAVCASASRATAGLVIFEIPAEWGWKMAQRVNLCCVRT